MSMEDYIAILRWKAKKKQEEKEPKDGSIEDYI